MKYCVVDASDSGSMFRFRLQLQILILSSGSYFERHTGSKHQDSEHQLGSEHHTGSANIKRHHSGST
jgi:hypothetical protein